MNDEEMYDEFGNYLGPEIGVENSDDEASDDRSESSDGDERRQDEHHLPHKRPQDAASNSDDYMEGQPTMQQQADELFYKQGNEIVLHEDKQYYTDAEKIYGSGVRVLVMEEDAQPLTTPIVQPPITSKFQVYDKELPQTVYSSEYLAGVSQIPKLIRNVAIIGHLHHGKTLLTDMIYQQTHLPQNKAKEWDPKKEYKFTDNRQDEIDRQMSLKASTLTVLLPDSRCKNYLFNFVDTPGHPCFLDEVTVGMRLADSVLLVVDCIEGVTLFVNRMVTEAIRARLPIVVMINKLDRLVLELKLPPADAYFKIKHTIDELNLIIKSYESVHQGRQNYLSPISGNVIFGSTLFGCCFTVQSFAQRYLELTQNKQVQPESFAKFLWGDLFFNEETRKFQRSSQGGLQRSFVQYILEPFYKIISVSISEEKSTLEPVLRKNGITLKAQDFNLDIKPMIRLILRKLLGNLSCLVDTLAQLPSAHEGTLTKIQVTYPGQNQISCDVKGPLCINIVKMYNNELDRSFIAYGRVISGTIHESQEVKVLCENYDCRDSEDMYITKVEKLWIMQAGSRHKIRVNKVSAGNWIGIQGIDRGIIKTATVVDVSDSDTIAFKKLDFNSESVMKIACEPLNPSELPKMLEGLRKINKIYPMATTKVEESGEHLIIGSGELYLDQILHDMRTLYSEIEIKVSEPFISINETVGEASAVRCFAETPNHKNQISMTTEPLEKGLADRIQQGLLFKQQNQSILAELLVNDFGWDELTANNVWAFGPVQTGSNILIDYTIEDEIESNLLNSCRNSIVQGFQWATREGPLCEEPMKNVKFKIIGGEFSTEPVYRSAGQIIPTARRVCQSAFLLASPRIMEPMNLAEVICPQDCVEAIYAILMRRRAHVTHEEPKPGTPLHILRIEIPVIESFGFETDLRTATLGQAMVLQIFSHWSILPGDPLDKSISLKILEPSQVPHLARELLVKTRRRKGLLEEVSVAKFFDSKEMLEHARQDVSLRAYF